MSSILFKGCPGFLAGSGRVGVVSKDILPFILPHGILLVLQEWWGLNDHMRRLSQRFANAGFAALAPDLYRGRVATDAEEASHLMDNLNWEHAMEDVRNAADYLRQHGAQKVAVMGFCMGGALTLAAAVKVPNIDGGICFYGIPPKNVADPSQVHCPLQLHFGDQDKSMGFSDPKTAAKLEEALCEHGKQYTFFHYPAEHAFMNETRPEVFDKESAELAFKRACDFLHSLSPSS